MILALFLTLATPAPPRLPSCVEIRSHVWLHGRVAVDPYLRRQGFTQVDIERIKKRCLTRS